MRSVLACGIALGALALAGCETSSPPGDRSAPVEAAPTFARDIAPIIFEHCSPCHRPGQTVPFALLNYSDVRTRVRQIAMVTKSRFMPPWLPEHGYGDFALERRLSDRQIETIQRWVQEGAIEGDPSELPPAPMWREGWQLGQPDLVVRVPQRYTLPADGTDVFRNFVIRVPLGSTRYVRAMEFQPDNAAILHHAIVGVDRTRSSRRLDEDDPEPGFDGMLAEGVQSPAGNFLGWTPGRGPVLEPADMSWPLERGTDLVVQLHMFPRGKPATIQPSIGFFFSDTPPTRRTFVIKLGSKTIDIAPGVQDYTINDTYTLPADVDALSVYPHAHYLGKDLRGMATLPDGSVKWLIWIKNWNFNRQEQYRYAQPLFLPRGTVLTMQYTYDNSAENVRNPHHPPRRVMFGMHSSDEMGELWLQVLPRNILDIPILARDYRQRELNFDIASAEMMVRVDPQNATRRNYLAAGYIQTGRLEEAIGHLREALRFNPQHAEAHNNLGSALQSLGNPNEAIVHFRLAVRFKPNDDRAHFNLANALNAVGQVDEAIPEFRRSIALNPDSAEAHNNLGVALGSERQLAEAIREFERALAINADYADAHNNLGIALGSTGNVAAAIVHFRRALEIRPDYVDAQSNLKLFLDAELPHPPGRSPQP
jgi:tetratricopeptide (TPR) repeat protein